MFNQYPYINLNDFNLDYILKAIKEMRYEVTNFVSINAIKYANPIQWDITSQYEKNTIVIDPQTGTAYISVAPVPAGVALTRPEYWTVVFDLGSFVTRAAKNFTNRYEQDTTLTATFPTNAGEWLVWGDTLYVANVNITAGDSYVVDSNIRHITVEEVKNTIMQLIADNYNTIVAMIGDLDDLDTTAKNNIVAAINELVAADTSLSDRIDDEVQARQDADGNLSTLQTTNKSNLVAAINEIVGNIDNLEIYNALDYGAIGDGTTDDSAAINATIAACPTRAIVYLPANHSYKIGSTININKIITFVALGELLFDGSGDAITIGNVTAAEIANFEDLNVFINSVYDLNGNSSQPVAVQQNGTIGVHVYRAICSKIHIGRILGFTHSGIYFDGTGTTLTNTQQIMLHDYVEILEVANCGYGILMRSNDAATHCVEANEFHFVWLLQCYIDLLIDDGNYQASTSNYFVISAVDNAEYHGVECNASWNIFEIAFMSTSFVFGSNAYSNTLRIGNNIETDVILSDNGVHNRTQTGMPSRSQLPVRVPATPNSYNQNNYGVPIMCYLEVYAETPGADGYAEINIVDNAEQGVTAIKTFVGGDTTASSPVSVSFMVMPFWKYRIGLSGATASDISMLPT